MTFQPRRFQVLLGSLVLGGGLGSLGDPGTLLSGVVAGFGLGIVLTAFVRDE